MPTSMMEHARFKNRAAAGRLLADLLEPRHLEHPVVIALPRGGVPVGVEIARRLKAPLDLLLVRKIGVPGQEELALGAVVDGSHPQVFINEPIRQALEINQSRIEELKARELREIERRRALYLRDRASVELADKCVILVDDGIATGATVRVALGAIKRQKPASVVIATGVASPEVVSQLAGDVDDIVCLTVPQPMHAIGLYYEDFEQLPDQEVIDLLDSLTTS